MTALAIWTVTTCIPEEFTPCIPEVFGTLAEATAHLDKTMRSEWEANAPCDPEGEALPYPVEGWEAAHAVLCDLEGWGTYRLDEHTVSMPEAVQPDPRDAVLAFLYEKLEEIADGSAATENDDGEEYEEEDNRLWLSSVAFTARDSVAQAKAMVEGKR